MTDRTLDRVARGLLVALVALLACLLWAKGSRAQQVTTLCYEATDGLWPTERLIVAGLVTEATWVTVGEGPVTRCADVAGLEAPYSWNVIVCNGAGCTSGILPDGRPGPAVVYRSDACRMDADDSGRVGGTDFAALARVFGDACP